MVALLKILSSALLVASTLARPTSSPPELSARVDFRGISSLSEILNDVSGMLKGLSGFSRWNNDPWQGVVDVSGVNRFAVRYASADRWQPSTIAATWELP